MCPRIGCMSAFLEFAQRCSMQDNTFKSDNVKAGASSRRAKMQVFTFDDITAMSTAALRSAGVTAIRPLPDRHYARYYDSFPHRENGSGGDA